MDKQATNPKKILIEKELSDKARVASRVHAESSFSIGKSEGLAEFLAKKYGISEKGVRALIKNKLWWLFHSVATNK